MAAKKKVIKTKHSEVKHTSSVTNTSNSSLFLLSLACAVLIISYFLFLQVSHQTVITNTQMGMMNGQNTDTMMNSKQLTLQLNEQNNSGEYGNALLIEEKGVVHVHISIKNAPRGVSQPAHIHVGSCIDLGSVKYPLTNVVNGLSDTTLQVSLKDLEAQGSLALNVHKSAAQAGQYVSCGNL